MYDAPFTVEKIPFTEENTRRTLDREATMAAHVEVTDNSGAVVKDIDSAISAALEEIGMLAEGYAKRACPVDTGRLRNSITHQMGSDGRSVYVGTNVEYAPHVELGTRHQQAQPFLRPAAQDHSSQYRNVLKTHMENA